MRLLIITQAVDTDDPVLGFFVRWIEEFSKHVEQVEVICLKLGKSDFPKNVRVHSLGKEKGVSRLKYIFYFYRYIWQLRHDYDAVFVHMNQEYILLAGWFWKLFGKRVYMWRNHYAGSWLTDLAAYFCTKVFCTSKHSYTARYAKTVLMPVGIDVARFGTGERGERRPRSILFLARMASSKRPEMLIEALSILARRGIEFTASFVGSPLPQDEAYYKSLQDRVRELKLDGRITFVAGVPNSATPDIYRAHEIFVNTSPSGMLDKTIFEAAACGCLPLSCNRDLLGLVDRCLLFEEGDSTDLAHELLILLDLGEKEKGALLKRSGAFVEECHSLERLTARLEHELQR